MATGGRFGELGGELAALLDFDEGDFGWRGDRRRRIQQTGASERRRPVLVTAAFTGMRASELRGLPWDAIDFENRVIRVRQPADHWGTLSPPKTAAGRREVPMARPVLKVLREWRVAYPFGRDGIVFCSLNRTNRGGVLGHVELWRQFLQMQLATGVVDAEGEPKYHFHALRHLFGDPGSGHRPLNGSFRQIMLKKSKFRQVSLTL